MRAQPSPPVPAAELPLYRARTIALLRRYFRLSLEQGRVPGLLGREFFRARVSAYRVHTFEDSVIFVHDIDRCLEKLDAHSRDLIGRITLQEYTPEEVGESLGCSRRHAARLHEDALDRMSSILLAVGLLLPNVDARPVPVLNAEDEPSWAEDQGTEIEGHLEACQDPNSVEIALTA